MIYNTVDNQDINTTYCIRRSKKPRQEEAFNMCPGILFNITYIYFCVCGRGVQIVVIEQGGHSTPGVLGQSGRLQSLYCIYGLINP